MQSSRFGAQISSIAVAIGRRMRSVLRKQRPAPRGEPRVEGRFAAFVSYRHVEPDRGWAIWLQRSIETFRVPRPLATPPEGDRLGLVFRDEDELNAGSGLTPRIQAALKQANALLVVCSPRAIASDWVNDEVRFFRGLAGHGPILPLLVDGDPRSAFPQSLREDEVGVELPESDWPLAADVRPGREGISRRDLKRRELQRLLAPLIGVPFNDLVDRDNQRRIARLRWVVGAATATSLLVASLAIGLEVFRRDSQRHLAESFLETGERLSSERDLLAAKVAFAASLQAADTPRARERLLEAEAQGVALRWQLPGVAGTRFGVLAANRAMAYLGGAHGLVSAVDLHSGAFVWSRPMNTVSALAASSDERQLAAIDASGDVHWLDPRDGTEVRYSRAPRAAPPLAARFSIDGSAVLVLNSAGELVTHFYGNAAVQSCAQGVGLRGAALNPGANRALVAEQSGFARLYALDTCTELAHWKAHAGGVAAVAISEDGSTVATWGDGERSDQSVALWTADGQKLLRRLSAPRPITGHASIALGRGPLALAVSSSSDLLAWDRDSANPRIKESVTESPFVVFDQAGQRLWAFGRHGANAWAAPNWHRAAPITAGAGMGRSLAVAPIANEVYVLDWSDTVRVINAATGSLKRMLTVPRGTSRVTLSADESLLAACGERLAVIRSDTGAPAAAFGDVPLGERTTVGQCLAWHPERPRALLGRSEVQQQPAATGVETVELLKLPEVAAGFMFVQSASRRYVARLDPERILKVVDLVTSEVVLEQRTLTEPIAVTALAVSNSGRQVAVATPDAVEVWGLRPNGSLQLRYSDPFAAQNLGGSLAFSPDETRLAAGGRGAVTVWSLDAGEPQLEALLRPSGIGARRQDAAYFFEVAFMPDGHGIAFVDSDGWTHFADIGFSDLARTVRPGTVVVQAVASSPSGDAVYIATVANASNPASVSAFDPASGRRLATLVLAKGSGISAIAPSPTQKRLYVAQSTGQVTAWDWVPGTTRDFYSAAGSPQRIAVDANESLLAVAYVANPAATAPVAVDLVDIAKGQRVASAPVHSKDVQALSFASDGSILTASYDRTAKRWSPRLERELNEFAGHAGTVTSIFADGSRVYTASRDGFARIFDLAGQPLGQFVVDSTCEGDLKGERLVSWPTQAVLIGTGCGGRLRFQGSGSYKTEYSVIAHRPNSWMLFLELDLSGRWLISGAHRAEVRIWDLDVLQTLRRAEASAWVAKAKRGAGHEHIDADRLR